MLKIKLGGFILIMLFFGGIVLGEALPPKAGTVATYGSDNGRYTISIKILGDPNLTSAQCTFRDNGKPLWSKFLFEAPSKVAIADNGQCIVMTNWGWYDEGASESLSIYDGLGNLMKEVSFDDPKEELGGLKWIRVLNIAPDGSYCVIGTNGKEHAVFAVYDCRKGELYWEKEYGYSNAVEVKLTTNGEYLLFATYHYENQDMQFALLDRQGALLYRKTLRHNFSWDVPDYLLFNERGWEFKIYDLNRKQYLIKPIPKEAPQK